ncbi:hypothetical protein [Chryseobacterium sp.]|uniref:hypothetical protein n=1 Tax=Chryseobacterium sp. TaxID=1871047 RepID=UPI0026396D35|nr:hypothetical protein [Chryseobacterium sp.]
MSKKLIYLFAIGAMQCLHAQTKAEEALKTFEQKYPQEKIHLLLDKSTFVAGENLWFKSFVFDGYNTSSISTSLFVELYDSNKKPISKKIIPLLDGEGSGSILLPATLKEDVYYIRAYTSWMANFNEDFQLIKPITVYNPASPEKLTTTPTTHWTASVYPESGNFIDGISTKLAVRLQSNGAEPADWEGYVTDSENPGEKIAAFKGLDQNVGLLTMTPKSGKKYQLVIQNQQGEKQNIPLPDVSPSGISLQVSSGNDAVKYTLKSKNLPQQSQHYKVLGTINNQLVYKAQVNKISDEIQYSIPNNQLVNGILQLTVFDDHENIIANRLSFVQPQLLQVKKPTLQSLSLDNTSRAKNSFVISKNPDYSGYTVLVLDANTKSTEDSQSLLSSLWLTGDITSNIINPAQYFNSNRNTDALDALLISERWKRFDWKSIISGNYPKIKYQPENYLSYKGKVSVQGKPAPNTDVNLIFDSNSGSKIFQIKSDANGFFVMNNLIFEDSMKFSYQLNTDTKDPNNNYSVYFQPNFGFIPYMKSFPLSSYKLAPRSLEDKPSEEITRSFTAINAQKIISEKVINIEEIKIRGEIKSKTKKLNNELSSALFKSAREDVFDFVNDPNAIISTNILQWLQGRVAGLSIQLQNGTYIPYLQGTKTEVYLDEMPIPPSQIANMSTSDIAMVKVIKGIFAGGFGGGNGAIAIYTRRGGGSTGKIIDRSLPSQLRQITLSGYDKETPFEGPIYQNDSFKKIPQDTRSVLFWNPNLEGQSQEPTSVEFYNNDDAKKYRIIILGHDKSNEVPLYYNEILP